MSAVSPVKSWPGLLLALVMLISGGFVAWQFLVRSPVDTDILSLLPADAQDPVVGDAIGRANAAASSRLVLLIEGATADRRQAASESLSGALVEAGVFMPAAEEGRELWSWLFASRTSLLCPADRTLLEAGKGQVMAREALRQWFGSFGISDSRLLQTDPLLLTPRLLQCFLASALSQMPGGDVVILSGRITGSAFRLDIQDKVEVALDAWREEWLPQGLTISRAGAVFHAAHGSAQARADTSFIGGITMVAILAIYLLMFRSLRPPLLAAALVVGSLAVGLAVTLLVFGHIHLMGLVFGSALTGMVVDYTTYFLITGVGAPDQSAARRRATLYRPLTLGMVTSVGAFAALLVFPVPAFQQIAVLGGIGLLTAWAGTVWLLPLIEGRPSGAGPAARGLERLASLCLAIRPPPVLALLAVAVTAGLLAAAVMISPTLDDVRRFQSPSPVLAAEEARIRQATGFTPAGTFFLVRGESAETRTLNEERLLDRLSQAGGEWRVLLAASWLDPSQARRAADAILVQQGLIAPALPEVLAALGSGNADAYSRMEAPATPPEMVSGLRGESQGIFWSIVPLGGSVTGIADLPGLADPAWTFVEPASRYSSLLGDYRVLATIGLAAALASTGIMLLFSYRRARALAMLLPTLVAVVATPSILGLLGLPYSFFSTMGLFLVVGAGVDYAIFQWEHPSEQGRWTRVGILLAATMTCISIGLLGLSSVLPVFSFGITVALGILLSLVLSPLVRGLREPERAGGV